MLNVNRNHFFEIHYNQEKCVMTTGVKALFILFQVMRDQSLFQELSNEKGDSFREARISK